ncbi:MAG TPA: DinB family protein [Actinopolymorphaceae bacterium]|jgi:uncharacterized damage-inducible protein DinB
MVTAPEPRARPDPHAGEADMLSGWLDWQRATVRLKCTDPHEDKAYIRFIPTSPRLTIATVVSHLTSVEHGWFTRSFLGDDEPPPTAGWDETHTPLPVLLDAYDAQCERSRNVIAGHSLDDIERTAPPGLPHVSLRWIVGHMIEETARHLGHLDLLRELADGRTSY